MDEVIALAIDLPKELTVPPVEEGTPPAVPLHGGATEGDVVTH
jgi:hypothetical protein